MHDYARADLRQVFAEELDEAIVSLERSAATLASEPEASAAREAVAEAYRVVHGVKGAARAAGFPDVERYCHDLETRLAPLREASSAHAEVGAIALDAAAFLGQATVRMHARNAPESAAGAPAEEMMRLGVGRLDELHTMIDAVLSTAQGLDAASAGDDLGALAAVQRELRRALREVRGRAADDPVARVLDVAASSVSALLDRAAERGARIERARRELRAAAGGAAAHVRRMRLVEIGTLRSALDLAVQELATRLGREVRFELDDHGAEIDRRVLDALREPLLHLVRNALDHGIERPDERVARGKPRAGTVRVSVDSRTHEATIVVEDDGRGIDRDAVRARARTLGLDVEERSLLALVFEHGFTTRAEATAVSGRGVGLDVVRQRIARLQGRVEVSSELGRGTRFELKVPLDLTAIRGVLVRVGDLHLVFSTTAVARLVRLDDDEPISLGGKRFIDHDGERLPLADLGALFRVSRGAQPGAGEKRPCVIVSAADRRAALLVDALVDERDLLVRPFPARIRRLPFLHAAALLGDGQLAYVVDVAELVPHARPSSTTEKRQAPQRRILVVDDSITTRQLERTLLEAAGFEVSLAPDGAVAWEMLSGGGPFDLVLSDIEMPNLDGFQLLARIRANRGTASVPVMLVTALESAGDRQRALDLGASAYVLKRSFDQEEFLGTLESLL